MNHDLVLRNESVLVLCALILLIAMSERIDAQQEQARSSDSVAYQENLHKAREGYAAGDFAQSALLYKELAEANPQDGENWLRLARSRYNLKEYRPAIEAFRRADEIGFGQLQDNALDIARAHAHLGDSENSLVWLAKALNEHRYESRATLSEDEAFLGLRSDARFRELAGLLPDRDFTRDEGWRYDLNYLLEEIQRLNATYSRQALPQTVRQEAERLRQRIPTLSDAQIVLEMQRLLALLGCSHNTILPIPGGRVSFSCFPLSYYIFPDGLYVIDGDGDAKGLVGARVVRLDDTDAEVAIRAVSALARRENDIEALWLAPSYLAIPQVLHALGLIKNQEQVRLSIRRHGKEETMTVSAANPRPPRKLIPSQMPDAPPPPLYLTNVGDSYWFKHMPEKQTVYFQFNQIVDKKDESIAAFARRLRQFLDEHDVQRLVVDLRHNNGGNTFLYNELVRTIVHFDASGDDRKLFVLIGRGTYSAAVNFSVDLERFTRAVFVGEPTGGKPNTHGDESLAVLPYSGMRFLLSCVYWQLSSPRDSRLWIPPGIPVPLTAEDYVGNRDPALELVLKLGPQGEN